MNLNSYIHFELCCSCDIECIRNNGTIVLNISCSYYIAMDHGELLCYDNCDNC